MRGETPPSATSCFDGDLQASSHPRFNLYALGTCAAMVPYFTEDLSYWASHCERLPGLVARDRTDDDLQWMVFGPAPLTLLHIRVFSPAMREAAYERQGGICPHCKKTFQLKDMHADHIDPWSEGGPTVAENCQMLCSPCNRRKGAK